MNILIVGSKGFIGTHCYNYFSHLAGYNSWGCDVVVDYTADHYFLVDSSHSDYNEVFEKMSFDFCINCSGAASVPDSFINPFRDFTLNVFTVGKILEAIRRYKPECKFINLSSAAVYGNPSILPVKITANTHPLSPYGWHKLQSELLCKEYSHFFKIRTLNLRVFSAYGPGLKKQLFWDLYKKSKLPGKVNIYGTGNESRDFIHIDDLTQVIELAMAYGDFDGTVVNVANGGEVFLKDAVKLFLGYLDKDFVFSGEIKAGDPINWVADISTIKEWGYKSKMKIAQGLKDYIEWAKESD